MTHCTYPDLTGTDFLNGKRTTQLKDTFMYINNSLSFHCQREGEKKRGRGRKRKRFPCIKLKMKCTGNISYCKMPFCFKKHVYCTIIILEGWVKVQNLSGWCLPVRETNGMGWKGRMGLLAGFPLKDEVKMFSNIWIGWRRDSFRRNQAGAGWFFVFVCVVVLIFKKLNK